MSFMRERMTRRALLGRAAAGVGVVVLGSAGCAGDKERHRASVAPSAPPVPPSPGDCGVRPGRVTFPSSAVVSSNGTSAETSALREVIVGAWERYLHLDGAGLRTYLAEDCIRMSGRWGAGTMQRGADAIVAQLASEAQAYERPTGVMAQEHAISSAELWIDPSGTAATAIYHDAERSGYRWCDSNDGVVLKRSRSGPAAGGWPIGPIRSTAPWYQRTRRRDIQVRLLVPGHGPEPGGRFLHADPGLPSRSLRSGPCSCCHAVGASSSTPRG
jgi:hypothetical protein